MKPILIIAAILGYVLNLYQVTTVDYFNGFIALRFIGLFFVPLGCVLGYFPN